MKKVLFGILAIFLFISESSATKISRPEFRFKEQYRHDNRRSRHRLNINRLSISVDYLGDAKSTLFKITPFFEIRRNTAKGMLERKELGIEIGKDIFPWVYVGQAIQRGWMKEDYLSYLDYKKRDYIESETRFLLSYNILSNKYIKLKGFVLDEFTYDFDTDTGVRNELALGFIIPVNKYLETEANWRHIDRMHEYDSDSFEAGLTLIF